MKTSRRYCSLLFVDIAGFSSIAENSDPENVKKILQKVFLKSNSIIKSYGGHLYQLAGDAIIFSFGFPSSIENQDERALLGAIEISKLSKEISSQTGVTIEFHIGLHSGLVLTGAIEIEGTSFLSIVGDPVNVASRLQQICPKNQIYVSDVVVKNTSHQFNFRFKAEVNFKGKKKSVAVYRFVSAKKRRLSRRGIRWAEIPLVGRNREMKEALNFFKERKILPSVLFISGEPGVGKTRFVDEFLKNNFSESLQIKTKTLSYGSDSFYSVRQFIQNLFPEILQKEKISDLENYLKTRGVFYFKLAAQVLSEFLFETHKKSNETQKTRFLLKIITDLTQYKINSSSAEGLFLVFEDLHWASKPLFEMIFALLSELPYQRVSFLMIARYSKHLNLLNEFLEKFKKISIVRQIELMPLEKEQSDKMISFILKIANIPDVLKTKIIDYSQGNPFFLEEISKMLVEKGVVWREKNSWRGKVPKNFEIPQSIGEIILSRFDLLEEKTKRLLELASAAGCCFSKDMVFKISFLNEFKAFEEALERNFVTKTKPGEYSFTHILIRDSVYSNLSNEEKIMLHREIFNYLKKLYPNEISKAHLLAHHAEASENWEQAFKYNYISSIHDMKRYSFHHSIEYLDKCAKILQKKLYRPESKPLFDYFMSNARIHGIIGNYRKSQKYFQDARKISMDTSQKIDYRLELSNQLFRVSQYRQAKEHLENALSLTLKNRSLPDRRKKLFNTYMNLADVHYFLGDIKDAKLMLKKAKRFITDNKSYEYLNYIGKLADILNDNGQSLKALKIRLEIEKVTKKRKWLTFLSTNYNNLGVIYDNVKQPQKALTSYQKANEIDHKTGYLLGEAITSYNISTYYSEFGKNEDALKWLDKYHGLNVKIENRLGEGYYNLGLAEVSYNKNEVSNSVEYLIISHKVFKELNIKNMRYYLLQLLLLRSSEILDRKTLKNYLPEYKKTFGKLEKDDEKENISEYLAVLCYVYFSIGQQKKFIYLRKLLVKNQKAKLPEDFYFLNVYLTLFKGLDKNYEKLKKHAKKLLESYESNFKSREDKQAFRRRKIVAQILRHI
ncbi:tetratricopeptide repeat protein [candidate division WOR-3 bacterium]|nr:tetratricopeptide repeat protein [candidate division WOR-3 bacterium]